MYKITVTGYFHQERIVIVFVNIILTVLRDGITFIAIKIMLD